MGPSETLEPVAVLTLLSGFMGAFMSASSEFLISNQYVDEGLLSGLQNITNGGQDYTGVPRAYLNYILFDKEYNVVEAKKLQISTEGAFYVGDTNLGPHEYLHIDPITISTEGYVYVYLSNQTPGSEVYFDDLLITHTQSRVIQKDDYYPFGLSISGLSSSRENSLENKYLYNNKELQTDFDLGWYDYGARMYDASIGRWYVEDPLAEVYRRWSPYNYTVNNPLRFTDPDGMRVKFDREEWLSRKEFREFKRTIKKDMRQNSETFNSMYKDLKDSSHKYVFNANNSSEGGKNRDVDGKTMIDIGINIEKGEDANQTQAISGLVAHETGHAWLSEHGKDVNMPEMPGISIFDSQETTATKMNNYIGKLAQNKNKDELNAMHIENVVRTELGRSENSTFQGMRLNSTYENGFGIKSEFKNGIRNDNIVFTPLNALAPPHDKEFYNKTPTFNIYTDFDVK